MNCPIDGTELVITNRANVEIDYCPKCRGIWLDRGELDKIIERSAAEHAVAAPSDRPYREEMRDDDDDYRRERHEKPKKKSFLSDLFDF
ncbi:MAG: zf-TFIIB domain-containing protein [Anaerolineae bacterium]